MQECTQSLGTPPNKSFFFKKNPKHNLHKYEQLLILMYAITVDESMVLVYEQEMKQQFSVEKSLSF